MARLFILAISSLYLFSSTSFGDFQKGMNLVSFLNDTPNAYCHSYLQPTLIELRNHGVNFINLTLWAYQETVDSEQIDFKRGMPDLRCLSHVVEEARKQQIGVNVRPILIILHEKPGEWRGKIPGNTGWFTRYKAMIQQYAELAQSAGADQLTIGSELVDAMTNHPDQWVDIAKEAKKYFSGKTIYSANHGYEFETILQRVATGERNFSAFYREVDYLGLDLYSSLTLTREKIPTYAQAKSVADITAKKIGQLVRAANAKSGLDKKIVLAEVGFKSSDHALFRPYEWDDSDGDPNEAVQALGYRVILDTYLSADFVDGIYFWEWDVHPERAKLGDKSFNIQNKEAAVVVKEYFNSSMRDEPFHKAYTYMQWGKDWDESEWELTGLRSIGAEYVAIVPLWYQTDRHALEIAPHLMLSPTREQLLNALKNAKKAGLKIMLKPHIDVFDDPWKNEAALGREAWVEKWGAFQEKYPILRPFNSDKFDKNYVNWFDRLFTSWRGHIEPPSEESAKEWLDQWFAGYEKFIFWHAEIAKEVGVESFCLGAELKSMDQYTPYWRTLIFKLRQFFHGTGTHLTYDVMPDVVMNSGLWPWLDYISLSAYMPLTLFKYTSVGQLQRGWNQHLDLLEKWLREKYPKKLVLFAEAGFMSLAGASQRPWDWKMYADESEEEQADCMRASLLELPKRKWLKGAYFWRWTMQKNYPLFNYDYYTPYKKKAEEVIKEFWLSK